MSRSRSASGFSIVSALFLLVTMTVLGVAILRLTAQQQQGLVQDVEGSRAYRAAKTGAEWGLYQLLRNGSSCAASSTPFAAPANALKGSLAGFAVTVQCEASGPYLEAGVNTHIYTITSTASRGGVPGDRGFVERQVRLTAEAP